MSLIADYVLDAAVDAVREATRLFVCKLEPTTYAEASSTYMLGTKTSPTMGAASDRAGGGRKTTVSAITDGVVNPGDTDEPSEWWALADHVNSRLLAVGPITSGQILVNGNTFTLTAFDVGFPDAA